MPGGRCRALQEATKGRGTYIETSLLECALALQEGAMMESYLQGGAGEPIGASVGMFKTSDGYMSLNARREEHFRRLAKLIGKDEWLEDPRYADARSRVKHRDELMAVLRPSSRRRLPTNGWSCFPPSTS